MTDYNKLISQLRQLDTEQVNPETIDLDRLSALEIARKINREDHRVAGVVERALEPISQAAQIFANTLRNGDRIFYIGAGTSGRLGVLDAAECPPTFGTDPEQIIGIIAGGHPALVRAAEGMEDDESAAVADLQSHQLTGEDFVVGICASQRTPYTLAGLAYAATVGCQTAFVICNDGNNLPIKTNVLIALPVGPEAITGSTRMKSGTAQKMAINAISTTAMILLGKTYGNLMIDLKATSKKLAARSRRILMDLFDLTLAQADELLRAAEGSVKVAMVMHKCQCGRAEAIERLSQADGFLSRVK